MSDVPTQLIADYAAGTGKLRAAVASLSREELLATPIPGKWSTQTVILHIVDAENAFVDRMKRIIAEDKPTLMEWHENDFALRLVYDKQSVDDAITAFEAARRNMTTILKSLKPEDFDRYGEHSQRGRWSLTLGLDRAVWHMEHHLKFVAEKRKALGK
ncbi:hypothetical protein BH10PLA1_BH10PLA1_14310 [soil metagenome]